MVKGHLSKSRQMGSLGPYSIWAPFPREGPHRRQHQLETLQRWIRYDGRLRQRQHEDLGIWHDGPLRWKRHDDRGIQQHESEASRDPARWALGEMIKVERLLEVCKWVKDSCCRLHLSTKTQTRK